MPAVTLFVFYNLVPYEFTSTFPAPLFTPFCKSTTLPFQSQNDTDYLPKRGDMNYEQCVRFTGVHFIKATLKGTDLFFAETYQTISLKNVSPCWRVL